MRKHTVIAQYHPAACLHNPRLWSTMLDDWANLPSKADTSFIVRPNVPADPTLTAALDTENAIDGSLGEWSMAWRNREGKLCVYPTFGKRLLPNVGTYIMQNAKWDIRVLERAGMPVDRSKVVDTMIAAYCMGLGKQNVKTDKKKQNNQDSGLIGGLGLKYLARRHLGMNMKTWKDVHDKPDEKVQYNAEDSIGTYLLWELWKPKLPEHFWKIDMPLLDVLMCMEDRGIQVEAEFLQEYSNSLKEQIDSIKLPFNPNSPKQVGDYVYKQLGITPTVFTKTKQPSTAAEVLEGIDDPTVRELLHYKELGTEYGTFATGYLGAMGIDGRIHTTFKQTSTATGRLSSSAPNLQNVPKDGDIRKLFIAKPGYSLVVADASQIELRVIAALANDEVMMGVLSNPKGDIHQDTADTVGVKRDDAKIINFLTTYGGGAWKLAMEFKVPIEVGEEFQRKYFLRYPRLRPYIEESIRKAHDTKIVTNWFGRKRRMDALFAEDRRIVRAGEREVINTPIQGTAADIIKTWMVALHYKHHAPMLLQVHDELIFEVPTPQAEEYAQWLREYLPTLVEINGMKFTVKVGVGHSWKEAKK